MMKTQQLLTPVTNALTNVQHLAPILKWSGALGLLRRRRSRLTGRFGLIGGGALLAAAGVLLFTTERGRALRSRWGKQAGAVLGGQVGKVLGEQAGGHPLRTATIARRAGELVTPGN